MMMEGILVWISGLATVALGLIGALVVFAVAFNAGKLRVARKLREHIRAARRDGFSAMSIEFVEALLANPEVGGYGWTRDNERSPGERGYPRKGPVDGSYPPSGGSSVTPPEPAG